MGYGLIVLALFDVFETFYPAYFMNAAWEFQTIGALVERVPVPLIGLWLVFYGKDDYRERWEKFLLRFLSWFSLIVGIGFFLLIPLGVNAAIRLNFQNEYQANIQVDRQMSQLQDMKAQLNDASTEQLKGLVSQSQGTLPELKTAEDEKTLRSQLAKQLTQSERALDEQSRTVKENQRLSLTKSSIKWFLGATVAGILFVRLWYETRWTRWGRKRKSYN
ncbi:MAG: HpsJ family protein [Cyanobacteriota bacterium]|nr:HpsJ family protein [Cyanobacteriota bacterium]